MKNLWLFIVFLGLSGTLLAQYRGKAIRQNQFTRPVSKAYKHTHTITDTLSPLSASNPNTEYYTFTALDDADQYAGYISGTNTWGDLCKAQQYVVQSPYTIEGALFWVGYKYGTSGYLTFKIWDMDGNTGVNSKTPDDQPGTAICPKTVLRSVSTSIADVKASSAGDMENWQVVSFAPIGVVRDYAMGIDMSAMGSDSVCLVNSDKGSAMGTELAWEQWSGGLWITMYTGWTDFDTDLMIFPLVDLSGLSIEEQCFVQGFKLGMYPNPAGEQLTIDYEQQQVMPLNLRVVDMNGKQVYSRELPYQSAGHHQIKINIAEWQSGIHFLMLSGNGQGIARKFTVLH